MRELSVTLLLSTVCVCVCESQRARGRSEDRWRCSGEERGGRANAKTKLALQRELLRLRTQSAALMDAAGIQLAVTRTRGRRQRLHPPPVRHPSSIHSAHPSLGHTQTNSRPVTHPVALPCRYVHSGRGHRSWEEITPTTFCHHRHHHQGGGGGGAPFVTPSDP